MKTKVLVTGAEGQLAKSIQYLCRDHCESIELVFATKGLLNITNKHHIEEFFEKHKFQFCINCAAYTNVELAEIEQDLAMEVNYEAVKSLAQVCDAHNSIFIHISTDYVFDGSNTRPYKESDPVNPINHYGWSKYKGEEAIQEVMSSYFIIRTSWLYSIYPKNFVTTIVDKIKNQDNLSIVNTQYGSPTSCHELAKFIIHLIESKTTYYGIYNFTDEGHTNWYEFALEIASHLKNSDISKIRPVAEYKTRAKRPKYSVLSNSKRKQIYDQYSKWEDNVKRVVNQLKEL